MALYCSKDNCFRYKLFQDLKEEEGGFSNGVWCTNKKECDTDKQFFYVQIDKTK